MSHLQVGEGEAVSCHAIRWGLPYKVSFSNNNNNNGSRYYVLALCRLPALSHCIFQQ